MKALSFCFQNLQTELKNLVFIKSYGSLKIVFRFSIFTQNILTSQSYMNLGTNWSIFQYYAHGALPL